MAPGPTLRVVVVGAGPAGLAALRALTAAGYDAVAYERGAGVGGVWSLDGRKSAAYRSLHLITSRERTEFGELPLEKGLSHFPSWDEIGRYLERYADHFEVRDRIRLSCGVESTRRLDGGGWEIQLENGEVDRADALVVATGHNDPPKWPDPPYPGELDGEQLHAHDYTHAEPFRDKNVLVVGMGNSAMDIATDLSHVTNQTYLSVRHGSWVIPKLLFGKPADQTIKPWAAVHIPWKIRQPLSQLLLRIAVGTPDRHGLPMPERGLFRDHPTITDTILSRIAHGEVIPKPGITELRGEKVGFVDGSEEPIDAIVWCTGYNVAVPYLDDELVGGDVENLPLYKRVLHLDVPDLFFVGMMQSTGSAFPIVERQAQLLAAHLKGEWAPPDRAGMAEDCERRRQRALDRWGPSGRPAMRVDFDAYMHELAVEMKKGRKRASRTGQGPPLTARVAVGEGQAA